MFENKFEKKYLVYKNLDPEKYQVKILGEAIYSFLFLLLSVIAHSYVYQIVCIAPFLKQDSKRVAFKGSEMTIKTGVQCYLYHVPCSSSR